MCLLVVYCQFDSLKPLCPLFIQHTINDDGVDLSINDLLTVALAKYQTRVNAGTWEAPSKEQEKFVHNFSNLFILATLAFHYMTPMTDSIANTNQYYFILILCLLLLNTLFG